MIRRLQRNLKSERRHYSVYEVSSPPLDTKVRTISAMRKLAGVAAAQAFFIEMRCLPPGNQIIRNRKPDRMFYDKSELAEEMLLLMTIVLKVLYTNEVPDAPSTARSMLWAAAWLSRTADMMTGHDT